MAEYALLRARGIHDEEVKERVPSPAKDRQVAEAHPKIAALIILIEFWRPLFTISLGLIGFILPA